MPNYKNTAESILKEYLAIYKRTSSGGQDLRLQTDSIANSLAFSTHEEEVLTFTDFDVSATKLSMEDRPELMRLTKLIKEKKIKKLFVYERDRLARNVYEYIYLVQLFHEYKIDVIFTATNATPFSEDIFMETWYGLSAQFEGNRISSRLSDARKRNPPSIIGFNKKIIKHKNGFSQRIYSPKPGVKDELKDLFEEFSEVQHLDEVFEIIMKFKNLLGRDEFRILDILRNPFFAGSYKDNQEQYQRLPNVEPIISLDTYLKVKVKLDEFDMGINQGFTLSTHPALITPYCGKCHKELKFRKGAIGDEGTYKCSSHSKNIIGVKELHEKITEALKMNLRRIKFDEIRKITLKSVNGNIKRLKHEFDEKYSKLENMCIQFTQRYKPDDQSAAIQKSAKRIDKAKEELNETISKLDSLYCLKEDINSLIESVTTQMKSDLLEKDYMELAELLIESIQVHEEYVQLNFYFSDFFVKGDH